MPKPPVDILVVEDNETDIEAVRRAFKKAAIENPLHLASDGVEALEMLRGENGKAKLPRPYVILLDINMPRMDGIQLLKELRASTDDSLKQSVVFMLTTSGSSGDRFLAYRQNVAGYFLKDNLNGLTETLMPYFQNNEFPEVRSGRVI